MMHRKENQVKQKKKVEEEKQPLVRNAYVGSLYQFEAPACATVRRSAALLR